MDVIRFNGIHHNNCKLIHWKCHWENYRLDIKKNHDIEYNIW